MSEFRCSRCGHEYICGCNGCAKRNRGKLKWNGDGDVEKCGSCGLAASYDQWFEEEFWQISGRETGPFKHPRATMSGYMFRPHKRVAPKEAA